MTQAETNRAPADDGLLALLGESGSTYTTRAGEVLELAPIKVRQMAAVARAAAPLSGVLAGMARGGGIDAVALAAQGDELAALLAALTGRPAQWVGELPLDDLVGLLSEALAVNVDFFSSRLQPAIERAAGRITATFSALTQPPAGSTLPPG